MRMRQLFTLLVLIFLCACRTSTPVPAQPTTLAQPTTTLPPAPTRTILPTATTALVSTMLDDLEASGTDWQAGTTAFFSDSSALAVSLTSAHASQGGQALQLDFEQNDKPKAIFFLDRQLDLSRVRSVQFDIYNPGTVGGVGIALTSGADSVWYESDSYSAAKGNIVTLTFDLTAAIYKAASTNWEFRASIVDLQDVHRLAIIILPARSGSAYVDAIRLNSASAAP
jgi:hypothetical protein